MEEFKNLQELWQSQESPALPSLDEIKSKNKKDQLKMRTQLILGIVGLSLSAVMVLFFLFTFEFELVTTKIALGIMAITIIGGIFGLAKMNNLLSASEKLTSAPIEYLNSLKAIKMKHILLQNTGIDVYYASLTIALIFYLFEFYQMSPTIGIIGYCATAAWILFAYFVIRPKKRKKSEARIQNMIDRVGAITKDIEE